MEQASNIGKELQAFDGEIQEPLAFPGPATGTNGAEARRHAGGAERP